MAETLIRLTAATDLIDGVGGHPACASATVSYGYPGDEAKGEQVWLSTVDGELTLPVMAAGRKPRADRFRMTFRVQVLGKRSTFLAYQRLVEIVGAFDDWLADHPTLSTDFVGQVMSTSMTTPLMAVTTLPEGPVGIAEIVIEIHSRLT